MAPLPKPKRKPPLARLSPKLHVPMTASQQLQWENKRRPTKPSKPLTDEYIQSLFANDNEEKGDVGEG